MIARINVRCEIRAVLAPKAGGDERCETADNGILGVYDDPLVLHLRRLCGKGFHDVSLELLAGFRPDGARGIGLCAFGVN